MHVACGLSQEKENARRGATGGIATSHAAFLNVHAFYKLAWVEHVLEQYFDPYETKTPPHLQFGYTSFGNRAHIQHAVERGC